MLANLVIALALGATPTEPWADLVVGNVDRAIASMPKDKPSWRCQQLRECGEALQGIDDVRAAKYLREAWKIATKDDDAAPWIDNVISTMAAVDFDQAAAWHRQKVGGRFLIYATEGLLLKNPDLAMRHMDRDSREESVSALAKIRPELGANLLRKYPFRDKPAVARSAAYYFPQPLKDRLIAAFPREVDESNYWQWSEEYPATPNAVREKKARSIAQEADRISALLHVLQRYADEGSPRAAQIADELCALAKKEKGKKLATDYGTTTIERLLLPEIGSVDTPAVREFLNSLDSKTRVMELAAAWSSLDAEKCLKLLDAAIAKGEADLNGPHGQHLSPLYETLLTNLAIRNPKEAALRLDAVPLMGGGGNWKDKSINFLEACKIVRKHWQKHPKEMTAFFSVPTGFIKNYNGDPTKVVEVLALSEKARSNPADSAGCLKELAFLLPKSEYYLDAGLQPVASDVVCAMTANDPARAADLAGLVFDARDRCDIVTRAMEFNPPRSYIDFAPLTRSAMNAAEACQGWDRTTAHSKVALAAKIQWQRAQKWPLDK